MNYINIASIPDRLDVLTDTIESLYNQADEINLYLNNYKDNPFKGDKKINVVLGDNSKGDAGKIFFVDKVSGFYFTCDDDLIYPDNYVSNTLQNYYLKDIVTYHGRTILAKNEIKSYYNEPARKYRCLGTVEDDVEVQIGGSGVAMFHTNNLKINFNQINEKNMFDLVLSNFAKRQKKKITCLKHKEGWIRYNSKMFNKETIYDKHRNADELQTKYYNRHFV
jgi:hypothetical protein